MKCSLINLEITIIKSVYFRKNKNSARLESNTSYNDVDTICYILYLLVLSYYKNVHIHLSVNTKTYHDSSGLWKKL